MSNDYPPGPPPPPQWQGTVDPYGGAARPPAPSSFGAPPPQAPAKPPGGWGRGLIIALVVAGGLVLVCCIGGIAGLAYLGSSGLDTAVVPGAQVQKQHVDKMRALGLLEPGERIIHFYSDAIVDLESGAYLATDRHVVLYNKQWAARKVIIPYEEIVRVEFAKSTTALLDSQLTLHVRSKDVYSFPVSAENGGDERFLATIEENSPNLTETKRQ